MAMISKQQTHFLNYLNSLATKTKKQIACPICGNVDPNKQQVGDIFVPNTPVSSMTISPVGHGALAELFCRDCGYCMLFDCKSVGMPAP